MNDEKYAHFDVPFTVPAADVATFLVSSTVKCNALAIESTNIKK